MENDTKTSTVFKPEEIPTLRNFRGLQDHGKVAHSDATADQCKANVIWESILCSDPRNPSAIRMVLRRVAFTGWSQKPTNVEACTKTCQSLQDHVKMSNCAGSADQCKANVIWESILQADPRNPSATRMVMRRVVCSGLGQHSVLASKLIQQALPSQNAVQNVQTSAKPHQVSSFLSWKRQRADSHDQDLKQSNHKRPKLVVKDSSSSITLKLQQKRNPPTDTGLLEGYRCTSRVSLAVPAPVMASLWFTHPQLMNNGSGPYDNSSCFSARESTVLKGVSFGGVHVVLLLDFIVFLVLLLLFSLIRKRLWDYGRLALMSDSEGFSGTPNHPYGRMSSCMSNMEEPEHELGFCSWLPFIIRMDEEMVKARCGIDAVHYLSFQRHLIILLVLITVTSVAVILPVNLSGNLLGNDPYNFGRTTVGNLQKDDNLLWLHTVFAVVYLILTVFLLRRHTSQMKDMGRGLSRNTLFVCSIPRDASEEGVRTHFTEAYPTCQVSDVHLTYDVAKLIHLDKERKRAEKNLRFYVRFEERGGRRGMVNPNLCGHLCSCCHARNCQEVDAITYYSDQEKSLLEEVERQKALVPEHPLGMAFISLQSEAMATYILKDFNALDCGGVARGRAMGRGCGREPQTSSNSAALKVRHWRVDYAPHPGNVYWENLSVQGFRWWFRCLLLNVSVFVLLTFLTTPSIVISTIDKFNVTKPIYYLNSAVVSQFFPTLLLWTFSALLPTVVYYSTLGECHWSRSSEQLSMMHKLYIFLLFMVLILPSLGLTSLAVFFRWLFDKKFLEDGKLRFECVFLPDQGAFFVNYVIAAALVGSGMGLLRLPGLLLYTIRMALARSAAERKYVKQNQAYEFEYGVMYGWTLCVFTVIMAYSITCPVIVPFGLLYLLLKHIVDKHNLYFAYLPARMDRQVHLGAVNQALAAPIICLIWLYFFSVLRTGFKAYTSIFTLVVLCLTICICISYTCFGHLKYLSPHNYKVKEDEDTVDELADSSLVYLPRVLRTDFEASDDRGRCTSPQSYGTTDSSPANLSPVDDELLNP
ncbi:hypothetical protein DPEC_G00086320 [Dallia pectoralis]|uniref:Uncharacterized protein n=1 Tax=Dallia pectoralis TaxID=75939 RepID=A0ACC2GZP0_DALPE|nr:hypothetical protein DPEC_G00086320 [Dallia pectoralis]